MSLMMIFFYKEYTEEDCIILLQKCIDNINITEIPDKDQVYYLSFHLSTKIKTGTPGLINNDKQNVVIQLSETQYVYRSNTVSMLFDSYDAFLIVHPRRQIIWTNGGELKKSEYMQQQLYFSQRTLLKTSKVSNCVTEQSDSGNYVIIKLNVDNELSKKSKIDYITFYVNEDKERIEKIYTQFIASSDILSQEIIFIEMDLDYKNNMDEPVYKKVFKEKEQLRSKYRNYKVIDNRK